MEVRASPVHVEYSPNNACVVGFLLVMYISKKYCWGFLVAVAAAGLWLGGSGAGAVAVAGVFWCRCGGCGWGWSVWLHFWGFLVHAFMVSHMAVCMQRCMVACVCLFAK